MRPLDFYRLGLRMAETAQTEAEDRTVINRVYYGLHHEACCRYFRKSIWAEPLDRTSRHTSLRGRFEHSVDPSGGPVARLLKNLTRLRQTADYQLAPPYTYRGRTYTQDQLMHIALDVSKRLLAALDHYSPGEAPDGCDCPTVYVSR